jgi:hypothetical protein
MNFPMRLALIVGVISFAYVVSYLIFHRVHITAGIRHGMSRTTVFWRVKDNSANRFLVAIYSPMIRLTGHEREIEWH